MDKQAMLEGVYQESFNDEVQKIAADPKYKSAPSYLKGLGGAMKAYYTDKPVRNIGRGMGSAFKGMGAGMLAGGAAGAGAGSLVALAKRLKGAKGGAGAAALIGGALGAYLGGTTGSVFGGEKGFRRVMAEKGIRRKPGAMGYMLGQYQFTPSALRKYVSKKK